MAEIIAKRVLQHDSLDLTAGAEAAALTGQYYKNNSNTRMAVITGATTTNLTIKGVLDNNRRMQDTVVAIGANKTVFIAPMPALLYGQNVQLEFSAIIDVKVICWVEEG